MRVFLIDDEQPAIDELKWLLDKYDDVQIEATFNSPKRALEAIIMEEPDVIFLDIEMPEMDGFTLAEVLVRLRKPPRIVFVTAYDAYALKAFEINAVDYVLKPVMEERLTIAIEKLRHTMPTTTAIDQLIKDRYLSTRAKRLPLWKDDRIHLVSPNDIIYLECQSGETSIYTVKGLFMTAEPLNHYEEILGSYGYFRCHRSYVIRLEAITEIIPWFNNTYQVKVKGYEDSQIPVSRRNVKKFKELLQL